MRPHNVKHWASATGVSVASMQRTASREAHSSNTVLLFTITCTSGDGAMPFCRSTAAASAGGAFENCPITHEELICDKWNPLMPRSADVNGKFTLITFPSKSLGVASPLSRPNAALMTVTLSCAAVAKSSGVVARWLSKENAMAALPCAAIHDISDPRRMEGSTE